MSSSLSLSGNFFELFQLPVQYAVDTDALSERYRRLQAELHPDRYAGAAEHEKRLALQFSARVNEAYQALRRPLNRALYLLEMEGFTQEQVSRTQIEGEFLMQQIEWREALESIPAAEDPETALDAFTVELDRDIATQIAGFSQAYSERSFDDAVIACVKLQYLDKLRLEAEQIDAQLLDQ